MSLCARCSALGNSVLHAAALESRADHVIRENSSLLSRCGRCSPRCFHFAAGGGRAPTSALEAVAEVVRRGPFLRLRAYHGTLPKLLYRPLVSHWRNAGQFADDGAKNLDDARHRETLASELAALCRAGGGGPPPGRGPPIPPRSSTPRLLCRHGANRRARAGRHLMMSRWNRSPSRYHNP